MDGMRGRPRPGLRHQEHDAHERQRGNAVPGRTVLLLRHRQFVLSAANHAAELRLELTQEPDRRHEAHRQHQPGHWPRLGLDDAVDRRSHERPAKDTNYTYKDAIVLLSDGL